MALKRILCVDDDPDMRTLLEIGLSSVADLEVLTCGSVDEAIAATPDFDPDLVMLDMVMPESDPVDAIRAFTEREDGTSLPVVFLTAAAQPEDVERLVALGAIAVIAKPFDPMALGREIQELHDSWREQAAGEPEASISRK